MHLEAAPERVWIFRHPGGIGQYTVGHRARLDQLAAAEARNPGLHLAGQSYHGIAMNACIEKAAPLADRLLAGVAS
jgi:oxygen-dependent protoporphyrinogen oxidase